MTRNTQSLVSAINAHLCIPISMLMLVPKHAAILYFISTLGTLYVVGNINYLENM